MIEETDLKKFIFLWLKFVQMILLKEFKIGKWKVKFTGGLFDAVDYNVRVLFLKTLFLMFFLLTNLHVLISEKLYLWKYFNEAFKLFRWAINLLKFFIWRKIINKRERERERGFLILPVHLDRDIKRQSVRSNINRSLKSYAELFNSLHSYIWNKIV